MAKKKKNQFEPLPESRFGELPGPLYAILDLYAQEERSQFRRVHRLIDALEWAVKWHTVLAMSDMLREAELPDEMKVLLSSGLRTPSLGTWNRFFRDALASIKSPSEFWSEWERLTHLENKQDIVAFRNQYAHGATPTEEECQKDCDTYYPVLQQLINSSFFTDVGLIVGRSDGPVQLRGPEEISVDVALDSGHAGALLPNGGVLDLWPLGLYAEDTKGQRGAGFYFFNALKNDKIEQLNYEMPSVLRDKELWQPFHEVLPLKQWSQLGGAELDRFRSRIETLTESFKGRLDERKRLKEFCLSGSGTRMLWGVPGIGKSALLAQVFKEMRAGVTPEGEESDVAYPPMIEYFIRRNTEYASRTSFLKHLNEKLDSVFSLKNIPVGKDESELYDNLVQRLNVVEDMDRKHDLVLFIDGLDEFPEITRVIPESRSWLKVILSSRPVEESQDWWREHDRENRSEETVEAMGENDIRALLYDVVDKYQDGFDKNFVQAVAKRSEGNPLYLKLLCDQIYEQGGTVTSIAELPKDMADLYEQTVKRVSEAGNAKHVLSVLRLLAEAKAPMAVQAMSAILTDFDSQEIRSAIDGCRELLSENPVTTEVEDYQLFHESLREWLRKHHAQECREMAKRLTDFCYAWQEIKDEEARRYALAHAAEHLYDQNDAERMWTLMQDEDYRNAQVQTFAQYQPAFTALQHALDLYVQRNGEDETDDARLCWLTLRAGEVGHQAKTDISDAFEWMKKRPIDDPQRIEDALERLSVLDEVNFFKATILLIWIEAERQAEWPEEKRSSAGVKRVFEAVEEKVPPGTGTIEWSNFLSAEFMGWWTVKIMQVFGRDCLEGTKAMLNRIGGENAVPLVEKCINGLQFELSNNGESESDDIFELLRLFAGDVEGEEQAEALGHIASGLAKVGKFQEAFTVIQDIEIPDTKADSLCDMAEALTKEVTVSDRDSLFQQILTMAREMDNEENKVQVLSSISSALAQIGDIEEAKNCSQEALRTIEEITEEPDRAKALSGVAVPLAQLEAREQAKNCFNEAFSVIQNVVFDDEKADALCVVAAALDEGEYLPDRRGLFSQAIATACQIERKDSKAASLSALAAAAGQAKELADRSNLFNEALAAAGEIELEDFKVDAICGIAGALARTGDFEQALEAVRASEHPIHRDRVLCEVTAALAERGSSDQVLDTAQGIDSVVDKARALSSGANLFVQSRKQDQARYVSHKAMDTARKIVNDEDKSSVISGIAVACARLGEREQAQKFFQEILFAGHDGDEEPKILLDTSELVVALAQGGYCEEAIRVASDVNNDEDKSAALAGIAKALTNCGDINHCYALLEKTLIGTKEIKDIEGKAMALSEIATAFGQMGSFHKALKTAGKVKVDIYKLDALVGINKGLANKEDFKQAKKIAQKIRKVANKLWKVASKTLGGSVEAEGLACVANGFAQAGDFEQATTVVGEITSFTQKPKAEALSNLAAILSHTDEVPDRSQLLQEITEMAQQIEENDAQAIALAGLGGAFIRFGKQHEGDQRLQEALDKVRAIEEDTGNKVDAFLDIAGAYQQAGKTEQAENCFQQAIEVALKIYDEEEEADALAEIAATAGKIDKEKLIAANLMEASLSAAIWKKVIPAWQNSIVQNFPKSIELVRQSISLYPFDLETAHQGTFYLVNGLLRNGETQRVKTIAELCSQLELSFLFDNEQ